MVAQKRLKRNAFELCARIPVDHKVKDQPDKDLSRSWRNVALPPTSCTDVEGGFIPRWWHGYVRPCVRCYLVCGAPSDVELIRPLSDKLIERTLQEFEAHIDAHESRLWRTDGATS